MNFAMTVHPRLRGELDNRKHRHPRLCRFIPAYAGNSFRYRENPAQLIGSSPLTRGTHSVQPAHQDGDRFIPAYAGNSGSSCHWRYLCPVHPRLRGELMPFIQLLPFSNGSSPLTRGTHLKWLQHYTNRLTAKLLKNISKQEQSY